MKINPKWLSSDMATDEELAQKIELLDQLLKDAIDVQKSRIDALLENPQDVSAEAAARQAADAELQSNIDQEISDRQTADSTLQSDINTEELERINADTTLQANIDNEVNNRINADQTLQTNIDNEATIRQNSDTNLDNIKVNRAGDTMSGSLDMNQNNINNINRITENTIITVPTYTTVTQDGTLSLTNDSTSVHFLTGMASNFKVIFPDALTLPKGINYEIYNRTTSPISLLYPDNTLIGILSPESVSSLILQENSTSNGMYSPFSVEVNQASGISNYNASDTTPFSTNSNVYQLVDGFNITPSSGKYAIWFNCSAVSTNNNADNFVALYKDGVIEQPSERKAQSVSSNFEFQLQTLAIMDFDGTQELTAAIKVSTGTLTINNRTGVAIRLGPAG